MYDYVIVTHIPVFYKINLYNEIAENKNILVLFVSADTVEVRSDDFITLNKANFDFQVLSTQSLQERHAWGNLFKVHKILKKTNYRQVLLGGWDLLEYWYIALFLNKNSVALALESTVIESPTGGLRGLIKRFFLSRVKTVFASGGLQVELLEKLQYKKDIKVTNGVGIINKPDHQIQPKSYTKQFLFIGRLSKEKNIHTLIQVFNTLDNYNLTIVGEGEEKKSLMDISNDNINFRGKVKNKNLYVEYQKHDFLILPSFNEPWGLVVEEALYFGLPVLLSKSCGSCELIHEGENGFIFNPHDVEYLRELLLSIDQSFFDKLMMNNSRNNIDTKDIDQVASYD